MPVQLATCLSYFLLVYVLTESQKITNQLQLLKTLAVEQSDFSFLGHPDKDI